MSDPEIKPTLDNVNMETGSVRSALHMPFDPMSDPHEDAFFMDELDHAVLHAAQHAQAASRSASQLMQEVMDWKDELMRQQMKGWDMLEIEHVIDKLRTWIGRS